MDMREFALGQVARAEDALRKAGVEEPYLVDTVYMTGLDKVGVQLTGGREVEIPGTCDILSILARCGLVNRFPHTKKHSYEDVLRTLAHEYADKRDEARAKLPASISMAQYDELLARVRRLEEACIRRY